MSVGTPLPHAPSHAMTCVLFAIVAAPALASGLYLPDPAAATNARLVGTTWVLGHPQVVLRLRQVDRTERLDYIELLTGTPIDPTGSPGTPETDWVSFVVEIENRSQNPLLVHPERWWLVGKGRDIQSIVGLDRFGAALRLAGGELPQAWERARPAIFENSRWIDAGARVEGLLFYRAPSEHSKTFHIDLQVVLADGSEARMTAPYRRQKRRHGAE